MSKKTCSICSRLKSYEEINYEAGTDRPDFASPYGYLKVTEPTVRNAAGLIFCPECGQYYLEREWTPGGSDDALRTYYHESVERISCLTAHKVLAGAVAEAKAWAEKNKKDKFFGEGRRTAYEELRAAAEIEYKRLEKYAEEVMNNCLATLKERYANSKLHLETLNRFYPGIKESNEESAKQERKKDEERAVVNAGILGHYLEKIESPSLPLIIKIIRLLGDEQKDIRKAVENPLLITFRKMKKRKKDLQVIFGELQKLKQISKQAAKEPLKIVVSLRKLQNSERKT